jgi:predicted nucleic acid-binding protein
VFLLDTSVTSEPRKPLPDEGVLAWLRETPRQSLFISVMTLGEHRHGAELLTDSTRKRNLEAWIDRLQVEFVGRILPVTQEIAEVWGRLAAANRKTGRDIGVVDALIAATGRVHQLTVVTRNVRHFEDMGVPVLNPWELAPD